MMECSNIAEQSNVIILDPNARRIDTPPERQEAQLTIENGTQVKFLFQKFIFLDCCLALIVSMNLFLALFYSDYDYNNGGQFSMKLLLIMFGGLCLSLLFAILRFQAKINLEISQKIVFKGESLKTCWHDPYLLMELATLLLQPYPFFNDLCIMTRNEYDQFNFYFKVNYIFVLLGFIKLFIIVRSLLLRTDYMSPRASRNCRMYGCQPGYLFSIKCLFKDAPTLLIGAVFIFSIVIFGLGLRLAERNLNKEFQLQLGKTNPQDLEDMNNAMWLTIITMTTVGYGDFIPKTTIGRTIDIVLVIWGIVIVSLMVVVLTNALSMDPNQSRALIVLNRLDAKRIAKEKAANLIGASFRRYKLLKSIKSSKKNQKKKQLRSVGMQLNNHSKKFQAIDRQIRSMYEMDNVYEQMTRQFEFINDQVSFLTDNQRETIDLLEDYLNRKAE